jgi:hypothetical protein
VTELNASAAAEPTVKVTLAHRHYGVHKNVAETEIPGVFSDYATPKGSDPCDCVIDEDRLLSALPDGFLPVQPARILLAVEDEIGGTGQIGLSQFRDWAKYFDAYCLNLVKAVAS